MVKRNKKSLAKSECNLALPRNKRLRIDIEIEGPNAYQDLDLKATPNQLQTIILLTITQKWRTLLRPESEHKMFREDELESEGDNETDLAVSQDTEIPQLYFVGQDNTAKPVSETLASFVTDAARKKLDLIFLEATILLSSAEPFVCPCYLNLKHDNYLNS